MYKLKFFTKCLILLFSFSFGSLSSLSAQNCGALVCNNSVQISLGVVCDLEIEPDMVLEAPRSGIDYSIELFDENGDFIGNAVSAEQVNTTLQYKVTSSCDGNTCWGTIALEANVLPVLESPCQFIAGDTDSYEGSLSPTNSPGTLQLTATDDCQKVINLMGLSAVNYNAGSPGNPIWESSDIEVIILDANGNVVYASIYLPGAFSDIIPLPNVGEYTIEYSAVVNQAVGQIEIEASVPNCNVGCVSWCGGSYPEIFLTPEQAISIIDESCGASLVSDIKVIEQTTGDICDPEGVLHVISYSANITLHGRTQNAVLLTQAFREEKIDLGPNGLAQVEFPDAIELDCGLDLDPTLTIGSPEYIAAATGNSTNGYPSYIDTHKFVPDTNIIENIIHIEEVAGFRDTMVLTPLDLDGDGSLEDVWVLVTIVDKILRDSIVLDTVIGPGFTNPRVPIKQGEIFCNVLTSFSDLEFDACAGGKKIFRTWTILDWCDTAVQLNGTQQIEISDLTAPIVEAPDDVVVSIDPWQCSATYALPDLGISDDCSTNFDIEWRADHGLEADGFLVGLQQGQGPIDILVLVTDECNNTAETTFSIVVVDNVPPVMVCRNSMQVSLTFAQSSVNSGTAKIFAENFNVGSHDSGCGDVSFKVARMTGCCDAECSDGEVTCLKRDKFGVCIEEGIIPASDEYGDFVKFCCEDAGQVVPVILVATDDSGNQNQCMVNVFVADNSTPTLVCEDVVVNCDDDPNEVARPQILGQACIGEYDLEIAAVQDVAGSCGNEKIIKEWYIDNDGSGDLTAGDSYCEQEISISAEGGFDPYTIKWPKHMDGSVEEGMNLECENDEVRTFLNHPVVMGDPVECVPEFTIEDIKPIWCESSCGLVGYSLEQDTIRTSDACLTIINKWSVIDWCTYDPNNEESERPDTDVFMAVEDWAQGVCVSCPEQSVSLDPVYFGYTQVRVDGFYSFNQIVKVQDNTEPTITVDEQVAVNTTGGAISKDDDTPCFGETTVLATATDFCGNLELNGDKLTWSIRWFKNGQVIDVFDREGAFAEATISGSPSDFDRLVWTVNDGCGNSATAETTISYADQQAPTPLCLAGLTTAFVEQSGSVAIWARDFDLGSFDNCTSADELSFSIVLEGEEPIAFGNEGFDEQGSIVFSCGNMSSFASLDIYVFDQQGNRDFCNVGLFISDNGNFCAESADRDCIDESIANDSVSCTTINAPVCGCDGMTYSNPCEAMKRGIVQFADGECQGGAGLRIGGDVYTTQGEIIDFTEVVIAANLAEYPKTIMNELDGSFAFGSNPVGFNYTITAKKEDVFSNGVSTLDLVLIQKHILGIDPFTNPHLSIAADVNGSQSVSGSDLVTLRQIILGTIPNDVVVDNSWVFAAENQEYVSVQNPWPFQSSIDLTNLNSDAMSENFIGIKLGDVSGDVQANIQSGSSELTGQDAVSIYSERDLVYEGESIEVDVVLKESTEVFGFQMGLKHDGLQLTEVTSKVLDLDDESYVSENGVTKLNWFSGTAEQDKLSYTLRFTAKKTLHVADAVSLSNDVLSNEVYVGNSLEIKSLFVDPTEALEGFTSHVLSNPIVDNSAIEVVADKSGHYQLKFHDAAGNVILNQKHDLQKGLNRISIERNVFPESGLYYYQLKTGEHVEVKPIVVID